MTQAHTIAIIGDRFMRPSFFQDALEALPSVQQRQTRFRQLEFPWPDEPLLHGQKDTDIEGLKELMGTPQQVADFVADADILVNHLGPITERVLAQCSNLKLVAVSRGGPVNIDLAAVRARGLPLVNTPGRNATAVAEFTIGMILAETRLITIGHRSLSQGEWRGDIYRSDLTGEELNSLTVGLIGYGQVGSRVVKLLKAFGCRILVHDPYVALTQEDLQDGVQAVGFEALLQASDVVSLHARVTPETMQFINTRAFALMKRGAYFINTARGPMVDYAALYQALSSGHLRGAGLETFTQEPPQADLPLLRLPNVTLTPHIAGSSLKTVRYTAQMVATEVDRHLRGQSPLNPC